MKKIVFMLCGKARCGKDTVAELIQKYYEEKEVKAIITSFSKYIKMYAKEITNWDGSEATKPRTLLQELGTEIVREKLGKTNIYAERVADDIDVYFYYGDIVLIKDVRFPHEIETIKNKFKDTIVIRINREVETDLNQKQLNHVSELALDTYSNYDYIIDNSGTLDDLNHNVRSILEGIK